MRVTDKDEPRIKRNSAYSSFQRHLFTCIHQDAGPLKAVHALEHPFKGLALDVIRTDSKPAELAATLRPIVQDTLEPASSTLAVSFERSGNRWLPSATSAEGNEITVLWFFGEPPPPEGYSAQLSEFHLAVVAAGAQLALSATFVPTVPGTDMYVDEIRAPDDAEPNA
jgi:hypothetical protein